MVKRKVANRAEETKSVYERLHVGLLVGRKLLPVLGELGQKLFRVFRGVEVAMHVRILVILHRPGGMLEEVEITQVVRKPR